MTKTDLWFNCDTAVLGAFAVLCAVNQSNPEVVLNQLIRSLVSGNEAISL